LKLLEQGHDPPEVFFTQPLVPEYHRFYWEAFSDLSTERQIGMALGPIPRSAITAYAAENELYGDAADQFVMIIRAVDADYLQEINSLSSRDNKQRGEEAAITDVEGVKHVLNRLTARANNAARKKPPNNGKS
jgi:hypothetical protein